VLEDGIWGILVMFWTNDEAIDGHAFSVTSGQWPQQQMSGQIVTLASGLKSHWMHLGNFTVEIHDTG